MDRSELLQCLADLADELAARNATARVYIAGGAAMALAYDASRTTRDVDGLVLDGHGPLMDAVRTVAGRRGLPSTWLNEQASSYMPGGDADTRAVVVYDHPNLRVIAASPEHLLVMKSHAARAVLND